MLTKFTHQIQFWTLVIGVLFLPKFSQAETAPDAMCNVSWVTTNSSITVSGLNAPHVILKLFRPNWSTEFSCFDNCADPLTLTGLTAGATYHLSYNLYDDNWQSLCDELVDVVIAGGSPTLPDLDLADLKSPASGAAGAVVNFSIDIKNIGDATASGDYVIGFYLSTNTSLDASDTEVGVINTGNTPVGTLNNVPAAITIPAGFNPGNYYLIGKADVNNTIAESREGNNTIRKAFEVKMGTTPPAEACGFLKTYPVPDGINLSESSFEETANTYEITATGGAFIGGQVERRKVVLTLDKNGNQTNLTDGEYTPPVNPTPSTTLSFTPDYSIVVTKDDASGQWETTISFESDLPAGDELIGNAATYVVEVDDGYLLLGTAVGRNAGMSTIFYQVTAKLDEDGNLVQKNFYTTLVIADFFSVTGPYVMDGNGYVFSAFQQSRLSFIRFNTLGEFEWKTNYTADLPSNSTAGIHVSDDEKFIYAANRNNLKAIVDKVDVVTGEKIYKIMLGEIFSASGEYTFEYIEDFILTADGGLVTGYYYREPGFSTLGYEYGKIDANGNLVWEGALDTNNEAWDLIPQGRTSDGGFLFAEAGATPDENAIRVMKITANGELVPTCGESTEPGTPLDCDLSYTLENGTFSLKGNGLNAAHVIVKLFGPNWNTIKDCFDNCGTTFSVPNLSNGTHHLSVNLYDANWSRTCDFLVDIPVGIGSARLTAEQFKPLVIDQLYPNPATDQISLELSAKEEVAYQAEIYNARGTLVDSRKIQLYQGKNTVVWDIDELPAGFYQILFKSKTGHTPVRFVKVGL